MRYPIRTLVELLVTPLLVRDNILLLLLLLALLLLLLLLLLL
jgi:hypothetical protein